MSSNGKREVVVVTGGTAGVGRAVARAFAREGAAVAVLARGQDRLAETERELRELGVPGLSIQTDVADADQMEQAAARIEEELGPIDVWVNNAMTSVFAEFLDIEPDEYRRVTEVVYHGTVFGTRAALKHMLPRDRGTIVLVGSALAYRGIPLQSAYCGGKHAVEGMFDSVRSELLHRKSNIHLTMVQLPAVNTPQFSWVRSKLPNKAQPVPPIFQPEVAADAVVYAARHRRRQIYVGMSSTQAIIGNKLFPWLGDWYLARTGYESQQLDEPEEKDRPDNLFAPVAGDWAAHGAFDRRAKAKSIQLWATKRRNLLAAGVLAAGAVAGANAAVVGLLAAAFLDPVWSQGVRGPSDLVIAAVGLAIYGLVGLEKWIRHRRAPPDPDAGA